MSLPTPIEGLEPGQGALLDRYGRAHSYMRVSVTDRCNYRCTYCMPAEGLTFLPRTSVLTYEEITRIVAVFVRLGLRRVRLTGGEPLVRRDFVQLVKSLSQLSLEDLAMTSNGHRLAAHAQSLADAGLRRVNISIDSLREDRFRAVTRGGDLARVLASIDACEEAGLTPVKLNCVVIRGFNEDEVVSFAERFAERPRVVVRFIEYMPFDGNERAKKHVPVAELRERLAERYTLRPVARAVGGGPAVSYELAETGQKVGFISPITEHFCESCNRLRLEADGHLRTCLSRDDTPSLRDLLRGGVTDDQLEQHVRAMVWQKVAGHEAHLIGGKAFEGVMTRIGG